MLRNSKTILSLIAGVLLSGMALYLTFRNIPLQELASYFNTVNYWWVIPAVALALVSFLIRVVRWQLLLLPVKTTGFWSAFHPLMIGFMLNCLLPARVGELARPAIFYKKEEVSFSQVLATVGAERVFDVVMLLLFFVGVLATVDISPTLDLTFGHYHLNKGTLERIGVTTVKLAVMLIACIILVSAEKTRRVITQAILRVPDLVFFATRAWKDRVRERVCTKVTAVIDGFALGFGMLKSPRRVGLCVALSFVVWALAGVSHYVMALGCPGVEVSFLEMYAVMIILCFFISLPSVPGFWGLWEAGGVFGLLIFGIPAKEAAGFTLTNHVIQMVPVIIVGLVSSIITGAKIANVFHHGGVEPGVVGRGVEVEMTPAAGRGEVRGEYLEDR